jgi:hypothetical protein
MPGALADHNRERPDLCCRPAGNWSGGATLSDPTKASQTMLFRAGCATLGDVVINAAESSLHGTVSQNSWRCGFRCPVCGNETQWPVPFLPAPATCSWPAAPK